MALGAGIVAWDLHEASPPLLAHPLDDHHWADLERTIATQRLAGFALAADAADRLPLTPDQHERLRRLARFSSKRVLWLDELLGDLGSRLAAHEIESAVLKGPAFLATAYPPGAPRTYTDIDLLVRSSHFDRAAALIVGLGAQRVRPEPRPGFTARFGKGAEFVFEGRYSIDLHRTLAPGAFGLRIPVDELIDQAVPVAVAGRSMMALAPSEAFLHACYHATVGNVRLKLIPLRDLVQLARHPGFDERRVCELRDKWGARAVVADAVTLAGDVLGVSDLPLQEWARAYQATRRERREYELHTATSPSAVRDFVSTARAIPSGRDRIAFVAALLFPSPEYRANRDQTVASRLRAAARLVGGRVDRLTEPSSDRLDEPTGRHTSLGMPKRSR